MVKKIEFAFCLPEGNITKPSLNTNLMGSWDDHQAIQIEAIVRIDRSKSPSRSPVKLNTEFRDDHTTPPVMRWYIIGIWYTRTLVNLLVAYISWCIVLSQLDWSYLIAYLGPPSGARSKIWGKTILASSKLSYVGVSQFDHIGLGQDPDRQNYWKKPNVWTLTVTFAESFVIAIHDI